VLSPNREPPETILPGVYRIPFPVFITKFWSGRILFLNVLIMAIMVWVDPSALWLPDTEVLIRFGAKDLVLLSQGQYWRLITPAFLHVGIIHLFFNMLGLYYVGSHLEQLLGAKTFLLIYFVAALGGSISSYVFNVATSAGASGALFGLLGAGLVLERVVRRRLDRLEGEKPRQSLYTSMVIGNLVLGFIIPAVDNSAHLGGLVSGALTMLAVLFYVPNKLLPHKPKVATGIAILLVVVFCMGIFYSVDPRITLCRITECSNYY
jgi:rhomboid protease GluP